jgi:hypothetical protein
MEPSIALALFPVFYLVCGFTVIALLCGIALLASDLKEATQVKPAAATPRQAKLRQAA